MKETDSKFLTLLIYTKINKTMKKEATQRVFCYGL